LDGSSHEVLVGRSDVSAVCKEVGSDEIFHFHFNHLMYNPSGTGFVFLCRFFNISGKQHRFFYFNLRDKKLTLLHSDMTSHFCWISDTVLFGYLTFEGKSGYYYVDIEKLRFEALNADLTLPDGHPSLVNSVLLTDTYPDNSRMQNLYLIKNKNPLLVARFYAPLIYNEYNRCDLHPRFNQSGGCIYVDSMHSGKRHLYRLKLRSDG
jgi:hypothetical protein